VPCMVNLGLLFFTLPNPGDNNLHGFLMETAAYDALCSYFTHLPPNEDPVFLRLHKDWMKESRKQGNSGTGAEDLTAYNILRYFRAFSSLDQCSLFSEGTQKDTTLSCYSFVATSYVKEDAHTTTGVLEDMLKTNLTDKMVVLKDKDSGPDLAWNFKKMPRDPFSAITDQEYSTLPATRLCVVSVKDMKNLNGSYGYWAVQTCCLQNISNKDNTNEDDEEVAHCFRNSKGEISKRATTVGEILTNNQDIGKYAISIFVYGQNKPPVKPQSWSYPSSCESTTGGRIFAMCALEKLNSLIQHEQAKKHQKRKPAEEDQQITEEEEAREQKKAKVTIEKERKRKMK